MRVDQATPRVVRRREALARRIAPRRALVALALIASLAVAGGCGTGSSVQPRSTGVAVYLTDAPVDLDSVIVVIREVAVHVSGAADSSGWITRTPATARLDLLRLRNGVFAPLGLLLTGPGRFNQLRLVIDTASYVVEAGTRKPIQLNSVARVGLKVNLDVEVGQGEVVDVGIDLDASRSLHRAGQDRWQMRPVLRARKLSDSGTILGQVLPGPDAAAVHAIQGADTLASTATLPITGDFKLSLLPPGAMDVHIDAPEGYRDTVMRGVGVVARKATTLAPIVLRSN